MLKISTVAGRCCWGHPPSPSLTDPRTSGSCSGLGSVPQFESQYSGFKCLCQHGDEGDSRIKQRGQRRAGQGCAAQWFMPVQSVLVAAAEVLLCMNFRGASGSLQLLPKSIRDTVLYFGTTFVFNPTHCVF